MTREEAAFPALLGSFRSQRIPTIGVWWLSCSIQVRICPGLYVVVALCMTTALDVGAGFDGRVAGATEEAEKEKEEMEETAEGEGETARGFGLPPGFSGGGAGLGVLAFGLFSGGDVGDDDDGDGDGDGDGGTAGSTAALPFPLTSRLVGVIWVAASA